MFQSINTNLTINKIKKLSAIKKGRKSPRNLCGIRVLNLLIFFLKQIKYNLRSGNLPAGYMPRQPYNYWLCWHG